MQLGTKKDWLIEKRNKEATKIFIVQCFVTITGIEGKGKFLSKKTVLRNYLHDFPKTLNTLHRKSVFFKTIQSEREKESVHSNPVLVRLLIVNSEGRDMCGRLGQWGEGRWEKEMCGVQECIGTCLRDFNGCFLIRYLSKDPDVVDCEVTQMFRFSERKVS